MKAASFDYSAATTLREALRGLTSADDAMKVVAGSQTLGPMMNLRLARPRSLLDVSRLPELRTVTSERNGIRIGAAVTHAEIEDGAHELLRGTMLQKVAADIAYRAIRNRGTIGGSLAHADPAADWVVVTAALGAEIELAAEARTRRVSTDEFMLGAYTTMLQPDELITAVIVPQETSITRWGYYKFCRKPGEFAEASCAAYFDSSTGCARIALGALDGAPRILSALAQRIATTGPSAATQAGIAAAVAAVMPDADAAHRKLHQTAVIRCLAEVFE